jgi:hypothetical protein
VNDIDTSIDDALTSERQIEPSAFFAARVMHFVRAEPALPPLPFPWKRIAAAVALLIVTLVAAVDSDPSPVVEATLNAPVVHGVAAMVVSAIVAMACNLRVASRV